MPGAIKLARRWNTWTLVPFALALAAVAVPYLLTRGYPAIAFSLQHAFSLVCHQRPERSFWAFGAPIAVCARCLGIYIGAAIGLLCQTSRRIVVQLLIATATLNLLDASTELAGLHGNWMIARFALGLTLGVAGGLLVTSSRQYAATETPSDSRRKAVAAGLYIR